MGDNALHLFFSMWIEYRMLAKWWFEHFPAQETDFKSIFFHCITSVQPDIVVIIWSKSRSQYPYLGEYFQDALSDLLVRSSAVTVLYRSPRSGANTYQYQRRLNSRVAVDKTRPVETKMQYRCVIYYQSKPIRCRDVHQSWERLRCPFLTGMTLLFIRLMNVKNIIYFPLFGGCMICSYRVTFELHSKWELIVFTSQRKMWRSLALLDLIVLL